MARKATDPNPTLRASMSLNPAEVHMLENLLPLASTRLMMNGGADAAYKSLTRKVAKAKQRIEHIRALKARKPQPAGDHAVDHTGL